MTKPIHIIYLILSGANYKQLFWYHGVSDSTIASIKKKLSICYKDFCHTIPVFLGGEGRITEVDDTVISRRGIIRYPTSTDDDTKETIWILGAIDSTDKSQFYIQRVENRQTDTLRRALEGKIGVCSKLHSDGYPSYPGVAENLCLSHEVVNYSEGFISENGTHTNNIEGFWAHLKGTMRKEHGVKRDNVDNWIAEYTFKRRFLMNNSREDFFEIFKEILKLYLS
ncbi:hypothetical protein DMUE_1572 [Dictyocoela muelleri]|nr:hypothetical protein DMUE_1572 [Dictyocoela muelleri]